jgi:osmoprotectant transport system permease protein
LHRPTTPHELAGTQLGPARRALLQHIGISLTALAIAFVIALPVGVWASRNATVQGGRDRGRRPSCTPFPRLRSSRCSFRSWVGVPPTAIIAMGRVLADRADPQHQHRHTPGAPEVVDAARGMGMSARQVLARVELPLALPLIVAGLRVAAVTVISVSVVAAVRRMRAGSAR